jgi:hypothetical protein
MSRASAVVRISGAYFPAAAISAALLAILVNIATAAQDRYTVSVPGGLSFAEFKGYEGWQVINLSHSEKLLAVILGNPDMIEAYKAGIPANGKPVPDGAKMAKIHYLPKVREEIPGQPTVPGTLHDIDFMVKDSKRFADSGGWGYGAFEYDAATDTFAPSDENATPPQAHDAKCGFACHTIVQSNDYVFTEYPKR